MKLFRNWRVGKGAVVEILRYDPEQSPPAEDIDNFLGASKSALKLFPFQTSRYVLREKYWASAWLKAYVACHVADLKATFVRRDKSFYVAFLEAPLTGDRCIAFRLTTAGIGGHTEWTVSFRRVHFDGTDDHFLCAEY